MHGWLYAWCLGLAVLMLLERIIGIFYSESAEREGRAWIKMRKRGLGLL